MKSYGLGPQVAGLVGTAVAASILGARRSTGVALSLAAPTAHNLSCAALGMLGYQGMVDAAMYDWQAQAYCAAADFVIAYALIEFLGLSVDFGPAVIGPLDMLGPVGKTALVIYSHNLSRMQAAKMM